jgi:hypothetical protein
MVGARYKEPGLYSEISQLINCKARPGSHLSNHALLRRIIQDDVLRHQIYSLHLGLAFGFNVSFALCCD